MRPDFALPALLVATLAAMVVYASSADRDDEAMTMQAASCEAGEIVATIPELHEASGLAMSRGPQGLLWSHNDSSDPVVYGIDTSGRVQARVKVTGASVFDWEAIATGPCPSGSCLFVADIGDNASLRRQVVVYRTAEPAPGDSVTKPVEAFRAAYPDGPQDAEALVMTDETPLVITKGRNGPVRVYRFPALHQGEVVTLEHVATLTADRPGDSGRITDGTRSPDGRWIALRSTEQIFFYEMHALLAGKPGTPQVHDLRPLREPQGEGMAWTDATTLYLIGEGNRGATFARLSCTLPD